MSLHEHTDDELKAKLFSGELGDKKTAMAEAVLRHRRSERTREWLKKHAWMGALVGALGLTAWLWPTASSKE
jgi:ferric-dicitrate binding protein FerR (iron transport regulator)